MNNVYKSSKDPWFIKIYTAIIVFVFIIFLRAIMSKSTIGIISYSLIIIHIVSIMFNTKYVLRDDRLILNYGLFTFNIYYKDIKSIKHTDISLYASIPFDIIALDSQGIQIHYNDKIKQISPKNEQQFIQDLNERINN